MTEEEYNKTMKALGIVMLDVDYKQFNSALDVAKLYITLNGINERVLAEENEKLEKENAELKELIRFNEEDYRKTLEHYLSEINELEKENAEKEKALKTMANLNADNVVEIDKLKKENAELKAQIEKMKCCENCMYNDTSYDGYPNCLITNPRTCKSCTYYEHQSNDVDKWELAK